MLDTNSRALLATAPLVPTLPPDRGGRPPSGTNHSRARREAYTKPRLATARWDAKDRTEGRFASLNRRRDRPRPPETRAGPPFRTEATRNSHSRAGGGQNHIDLGSDACMSASFLSSTSAPSAHESPGARIERTHLWARSKCERVQRGSIWCDGVG